MTPVAALLKFLPAAAGAGFVRPTLGRVAAVAQPVAASPRSTSWLPKHKGLRTYGHNVFLCHHVDRPEAGMPIDFGVEVTRRFEPEGEVHCVETPAAEALTIVHRGPHSGLAKAHAALHGWCAANGGKVGAYSLEIYQALSGRCAGRI